jgi:hypothetical protein
MKPFTTLSVVVFSIISLLHLLRLLSGWEVIINGLTVPVWISVPGFLIAGTLAVMVWRESRS